MNATSQEEALKRLEPFKLDGVVQKLACPFLMLHGEESEQISLSQAKKCFDAVGGDAVVEAVGTSRVIERGLPSDSLDHPDKSGHRRH